MTTTTPSRRVEIYDTTLRDGAQGEGVAFSLADKLRIAQRLDDLGVDYIEGGYPLSNPKDAAFFEEARKLTFRHAQLAAFGMTRRKGVAAADDPGMAALVAAQTPVITVVGKTWDLHVDEVLRVSRDENLAMIRDSVGYCSERQRRRGGGGGAGGPGGAVFYDAEHFFDGYRANPGYALATLRAALEGGAVRLVLCDTNGGSLPQWIGQAVGEVMAALQLAEPSPRSPAPSPALGIHCHNDAALAVANSLAAVAHGAVQVQGTINGIGERCGNVDLVPVVANLRLKLGHACLHDGGGGLAHLTEVSRYVYELANLPLVSGQPYVGSGAFSHKGGMHVHAVQRIAHSYEHVPPQSVGNTRRVLVSELSGVSNIAATLGPRYAAAADRDVQKRVLERLSELENQGYQFEAALASFELLLHEQIGTPRDFWTLDRYRCVITKRNGDATTTEAIVKLAVGAAVEHQVADGDGPINALDAALRRCLEPHYPALRDLHLADYRVRVVNPRAESAAKVRVIIDFRVAAPDPAAAPAIFSTIGVNENIVDASWQALTDAFTYHLIQRRES